jgi:hypothetical protein
MTTAGESQDTEQDEMETHEPTTANADLWSKYFQDEWGRWFQPLGGSTRTPVAQVAEGTAARVASFLSLVAAGPIAWLYNTNAPNVTQIRPEPPAFAIHGEFESIEDPAA